MEGCGIDSALRIVVWLGKTSGRNVEAYYVWNYNAG